MKVGRNLSSWYPMYNNKLTPNELRVLTKSQFEVVLTGQVQYFQYISFGYFFPQTKYSGTVLKYSPNCLLSKFPTANTEF